LLRPHTFLDVSLGFLDFLSSPVLATHWKSCHTWLFHQANPSLKGTLLLVVLAQLLLDLSFLNVYPPFLRCFPSSPSVFLLPPPCQPALVQDAQSVALSLVLTRSETFTRCLIRLPSSELGFSPLSWSLPPVESLPLFSRFLRSLPCSVLLFRNRKGCFPPVASFSRHSSDCTLGPWFFVRTLPCHRASPHPTRWDCVFSFVRVFPLFLWPCGLFGSFFLDLGSLGSLYSLIIHSYIFLFCLSFPPFPSCQGKTWLFIYPRVRILSPFVRLSLFFHRLSTGYSLSSQPLPQRVTSCPFISVLNHPTHLKSFASL